MIRNYFISAIRNLLRNKTFAILNIGGLILGVGCSIVLFSYLSFEHSYNKYNSNYKNIYRVVARGEGNGNVYFTPTLPHPLGKAIKEETSAAQKSSRLYRMGGVQFTVRENGKEKKFYETDVGFGETDLFDILDFKWLAGTGDLTSPRSVVLSESIAKKYYNTSADLNSIIGRTVVIDNEHTLTINGIYEDLPNQTDFNFNMVVDYESQDKVNDYFGEGKMWKRLNGPTSCILLLSEGTDPLIAENDINSMYEKYNQLDEYTLILQPLSDVHYNTDYWTYSGTFPTEGSWTMGVIALLLIVASSINFINLSTAKATNRAKEVGVRKVMGSSRQQLIIQHMTETLIIVFISLLGALAIAELLFKLIAPLIDQSLSLLDIPNTTLLPMISLLLVGLTLLTGLYPALIVSSFTPIQALKASFGGGENKGKMSLRRLLVLIQFIISQGLLIGTIITIMQNDFLLTHDLGFKQKGVVSVILPERDFQKTSLLKNELEKLSEISLVSAHIASPLSRSNNWGDITYKDGEHEIEVNATFKEIDESYLGLFEIPLLAGENVRKGDSLNLVMVNETMITKLGIKNPEEAIGKTLNAYYNYKIIGVTRDFFSNSLRSEKRAVIMNYDTEYFDEIAFSFSNNSPKTIESALANLNKIWEEVYPQYVLNYDFLDKQILKQYDSESRMVRLFELFAGIAIFIGCLGLYGLIDFMAIKKTKEIGIRKVLGATALNILILFVRELLILMTISIVIAAPLMHRVLNGWLDSYEHRISIGWEVFVLSFFSIAVFAIITIGYRSFDAANLNPVQTLKDE